MSFLSKVMFWKKDDFSFDDTPSDPMGAAPGDANQSGLDQQPPVDNLGLNNDSLGLNKDTLGLDKDANLGLDQGSSPDSSLEPSKTDLLGRTGGSVDNPSSLQDSKSFSISSQNQQQSMGQPMADPKKDFDLISSKLDTIKAELDAMNQRIQSIERSVNNNNSVSDPRKDSLW